MVKFGQLVDEGKATFKINPISRAFGVIIFEDKMDEANKNYCIIINNKEYKLSINPFDSNIKDVTLDTNEYTEELLREAEVISL
ncbi:hypothetical protein [Lysinibacillus endophyticus]|uniref:hypothetical protein n=1 Tax=Ureibacillus endophyticus TaxID=1978490 RepID=UPI00209F13D7|nr:hypothetical protein [Lysinibacillus endophyticus]MCP1143681.1 hypothetical protein [Lysinibacillus endophyticus]